MELSTVMAITASGILVYIGHHGELIEIVGGKKGALNLRKLK